MVAMPIACRKFRIFGQRHITTTGLFCEPWLAKSGLRPTTAFEPSCPSVREQTYSKWPIPKNSHSPMAHCNVFLLSKGKLKRPPNSLIPTSRLLQLNRLASQPTPGARCRILTSKQGTPFSKTNSMGFANRRNPCSAMLRSVQILATSFKWPRPGLAK